MSSHGTPAAHLTLSARAAASRANGAKSKGPTTALGKARSAQNALKHGLCAKKHVLLPDDSRAEFKALQSALLEDLRPEGALQTLLAHRLVAAAWRLARADRLEFGLLIGGDPRDSPGRALVRDGRAAAAFATLVRYRGGAQAEIFRTLKALKELQAAAAKADRAADAMPEPPVEGTPGPPVEGTPGPRPGAAALRLPAERPALPPLGEVARPRVPSAAEARRSRRIADADATRNEPERPGTGHRCATDATRNEPERPRDRNRQGLAAVSCRLPVDR
jgi:hypothetical protein